MTGFKNMDRLNKKLSNLKGEMGNVGNILLDAAITVKNEAQRSMQNKSGGETQVRYRNGQKRIVTVSKPGDPPNTDTGRLVRSVKARKTAPNEAEVGVLGQDAPYGKHLEYGTVNMEARPWLRPAFKKSEQVIKEKLKMLGKKLVVEGIK